VIFENDTELKHHTQEQFVVTDIWNEKKLVNKFWQGFKELVYFGRKTREEKKRLIISRANRKVYLEYDQKLVEK